MLDVGQVVAGNFCGGLLAYFGADVIKARIKKGIKLAAASACFLCEGKHLLRPPCLTLETLDMRPA